MAVAPRPYTWEKIASEIYNGILDEGPQNAVPSAQQLKIVKRALSIFFADLIERAPGRRQHAEMFARSRSLRTSRPDFATPASLQ